MTYEAMSYRDDEVGLRHHRDELLAQRANEASRLPAWLVTLYARRVSRVAGGLTAALGMGAVVAATALKLGAEVAFGHSLLDVSPTALLVVAVAAVPLVMAVARIVASSNFQAIVRRHLVPTKDARADVERLSRSAIDAAARHVDALEVHSVAAPLVGLALLAPLSIHFVVFLMMSLGDDYRIGHLTSEYDGWIAASLLIVGVAHGTLCVLAVRFAKRLRATRTSDVAWPSAWAPFGWTLVAGCVPGVILWLVPPVLVAVTGLVFVPASFARMKQRAREERRALESAMDDAPLSALLASSAPDTTNTANAAHTGHAGLVSAPS